MSTSSTKKECFLSLGSNLGNRISYLKQGISGLKKVGVIIHTISSVYETEPVDMPGVSYFYNIVLKVETNQSPEELLDNCLRIEKSVGRERKKCNESRILDIDILFYNRLIIKNEKLHIPHKRAHLRKFVLIPLQEIAADFVHPTLRKKVNDLLKECPDKSSVRICNEEWTFPIREGRSK